MRAWIECRRWTAVLACFVTGSAAVAQEPSNLPATAPVPCPDIVTQTVTEVEGTTFACGTVSVPVDYGDPDGARIDLMYGILRSTSMSAAPDPVIYLHGGPGGAELGNLTSALAERLSTLRQRRDIIVFDQRGSGFSPGEIECNDVFAANRDAAWEAAPAIAEVSGMNLGAASSEFLIPLCAGHLNGLGVDLSQYNTISNARDVASLAAALGYGSYNIYGHSYGTRLGLEVIRQNPAGLRSVLLDSVLPPNVAWRERLPETNEEAFLGIYSMCLAAPTCAEAYPDLVEALNGVFATLADQPLTTEGGLPITPADLEKLILLSANQAGGQWRVRYLPRMIHDLALGDTTVYEALYFQSYALSETAEPPAFNIPGTGFTARILLNRANGLAHQADSIAETALVLANQARAMAADAEDTPATGFLHTLARLEDTPYSTSLDEAYAAKRTALPLQPATSRTLRAFVDTHFVGVDRQILATLVDELQQDDIAEIYRRLRNQDRYVNSLQELGFTLRLFNCNDSVPFNSAEAARTRQESYHIPGLTAREGRMMAYELDHCYSIPTGTVPRTFHDPVTGDGSLPVLIFTGTNDTQTATSWAEQAANDLIGSQFVRFPNTGHGATQFSECAKDVAAAFFDQPKTPVVSSCREGLAPIFVLPGDMLP